MRPHLLLVMLPAVIVMGTLEGLAYGSADERASLPAGEDPREAEARELFASGHYERAQALFARLHGVGHDPVFLRNIGRCQQMRRQPDEAIVSFRAYLAQAALDPGEREEIDGYIRDMEALKAEQREAAAQEEPVAPDTALQLAAPAPPAPAPSPPAAMVAMPPAQTKPAPTPFYHRAWFWVGTGVLAAAAITTAAVLLWPRAPVCGDEPACIRIGAH